MLQIRKREAGDVTILDIRGNISDEGTGTVEAMINGLVRQGRGKIILNLAGVPWINSTGLGEITRSWILTRRQGGSLKLLNLTQPVAALLSATKLLDSFEAYTSEADAIASFATTPTPP